MKVNVHQFVPPSAHDFLLNAFRMGRVHKRCQSDLAGYANSEKPSFDELDSCTAIRDHLWPVANPQGNDVNDIRVALNLIREGNRINYLGNGRTLEREDSYLTPQNFYLPG